MQLLLITLWAAGVELAFTRRLPKVSAPDLALMLVGIAGIVPVFALWPPLVLHPVLAFVLWSFLDYWVHRLQHCRLLWPFHSIHHSAEAMSPLVRFRGHPLEIMMTSLWPLAVIQQAPLVAVGLSAYQCLVHCDLDWTWGWFGRWVIVPPLAHRVHHSAVHRDVNFGTMAIWDHLFGTYAEPVHCPVGLDIDAASIVPPTTMGSQ